MNDLNFVKMSGAGNDFIVIDNRDGKVAEPGRDELIAGWCSRRVGIGADGVLLVEPPEGDADFRMRYYNADGGEAETCGNGARCISAFAHSVGAAPAQMRFETMVGPYEAKIIEGGVILGMGDPHSLRRDIDLNLPGIAGSVDAIDTGVPHAVYFVADAAAIDLQDLGAKIRYHEAFAPAGVNANFAQVLDDGRIAVRTYERGVEGETLACGTGSIAVALVAKLRGLADKSPVRIQTTGGPVLKIHFEHAKSDSGEETFGSIKLEGEARVVYQGVIPHSAMAPAFTS